MSADLCNRTIALLASTAAAAFQGGLSVPVAATRTDVRARSRALFTAYDADAQRVWTVARGAPEPVAVTGTAIPGGGGQRFSGFTGLFGGVDSRTAFIGEGNGSWAHHDMFHGVYVVRGNGASVRIVDTTDRLPPLRAGGAPRKRFRLISGPVLVPSTGAGTVIFSGADAWDGSGTCGIYAADAGGAGNLRSLVDSEAGTPRLHNISGPAVALSYDDAAPPPILFAARADVGPTPRRLASRRGGTSLGINALLGSHSGAGYAPPCRLVGIASAVPDAVPAQRFAAFGSVAAGGRRAAFVGEGDAGVLGVYTLEIAENIAEIGVGQACPGGTRVRRVADTSTPTRHVSLRRPARGAGAGAHRGFFTSFGGAPAISPSGDVIVFRASAASAADSGLFLWRAPRVTGTAAPIEQLVSLGSDRFAYVDIRSLGFDGACAFFYAVPADQRFDGVFAVGVGPTEEHATGRDVDRTNHPAAAALALA